MGVRGLGPTGGGPEGGGFRIRVVGVYEDKGPVNTPNSRSLLYSDTHKVTP